MTTAARYPNLHVLGHPLILHKLTHMRDKDTSTRTFRQLLREISLLMGYEITRNLPLMYEKVETPLKTFDAPVIAGKKLAIVPILRAGVGMADGLMELVPSARVGHIGVYRDHDTLRPVEYLVKLPEPEGRLFILTDPMLATGYTAAYAVDVLLKRGAQPDNISLHGSCGGAGRTAGVLRQASQCAGLCGGGGREAERDGPISFPGLGDAGDRLFGTK